jgi:hypothetical protein
MEGSKLRAIESSGSKLRVSKVREGYFKNCGSLGEFSEVSPKIIYRSLG